MRIELSPKEQALFDTIRFDATSSDFYTVAQENGERAAELMRSLIARRAIPDVRLRYFTDPDLFPGGRGRSHKQVFNDNGRTNSEILEHPSFLNYLNYFICGPRLPTRVIARFKELAAEPFRELESLRQFVRAQTRELKLHDAGEEFFKIAMECELEPYEAKTLRTDAMTASRSRR